MYDYGEPAGGQAYLVMELIGGRPASAGEVACQAGLLRDRLSQPAVGARPVTAAAPAGTARARPPQRRGAVLPRMTSEVSSSR